MDKRLEPLHRKFGEWIKRSPENSLAYEGLLKEIIRKCDNVDNACNKKEAVVTGLYLAEGYLGYIFEMLCNEPANVAYTSDYIVSMMEWSISSTGYIDRFISHVKKLPDDKVADIAKGVRQDLVNNPELFSDQE